MSTTLPAIVVGGYLGAGKTTLVNRLLREAGGRRIAVMVNDFGDVNIDADLIVAREGTVLSLAGGCVCCAVGSDLIEAVMALPGREPAFDLVLVETSGVALPGAVARSLRLAPGIEVDGVVVLVDAETVRRRADDRYVGDAVLQQLAEADLLVVNKVDLVDASERAALDAWLDGVAPRARRVSAVEAELPAELVLGLADAGEPAQALAGRRAGWFTDDRSDRLDGERRGATAPATTRYVSATLALPQNVDCAALERLLADPVNGVLRAKGVVHDADGLTRIVQAVGARVRVTSPHADTPAARVRVPRLVLIGLRGQLDVGAIASAIGAAVDGAYGVDGVEGA
jgi:G3E family GTPase